MEQYTVSAILPVKNAENSIKQCVDSILNQTVKSVELIIVESGSTDKTVEICKKYEVDNPNVKFISLEERGVSIARNAGIENANGKFITFLDSDDYIKPEMYESLVSIAENNNADIVGCGYYTISARNILSEEKLFGNLMPFMNRVLTKKESFSLFCELDICSFFVWSKIYKKQMIIDNHIKFPLDTIAGEDFLFNCDAYLACNQSYHTDTPYCYHKVSYDNLTARAKKSPSVMKEMAQYSWHRILTKIMNTDNSICDTETKMKARYRMMHDIAGHFLRYQYNVVNGLYLTDQLDYNRPYIFWGASQGGACFANMEQRFKNLVFVDNDRNKTGTMFLGYPVISPEQLMNYHTKASKIIITSVYFIEIYFQLKEMGIVSKLDDVMIMGGKTIWDKFYIDCFDLFIKDFYLNVSKNAIPIDK